MAIDVSAARAGPPAALGLRPERLAPPAVARALVPRRSLVRALRAASDARLVMLCAPAGYGKTALLSQWAMRDPRPFAWVTVGPEHRDPVVMEADLVDALRRLGPGEAGARGGGARSPVTTLGRVRRALAAVRAPAVLALDDAHRLTSDDALDAVRMIVAGLPPGSQVALAGRAEPDLRTALLRSRGLLLRLGPAELAMRPSEAARLLEGEGLDLSPEAVQAVTELTEGWPAALHLAARSLAGRDDPDAAAARFGGDDRAVGEYVEDEVLGALTAEQADLITRTAVLDRLTPAACDALLGRTGSGQILAAIARCGGLIVHDDDEPGSYRHHRVVADALRARLRRDGPELVPALHAAASAWFEEADDPYRAIAHAAAAGDRRRLGSLVWTSLPGHLANGRLAAVRRWVALCTPDEIGADPALAVAAAWCGLEGGGQAVEHWIEVAGRAPRTRLGADLDGALGILEAAVAGSGAGRMREDAAVARGRWSQDSPWRAVACALEGVATDLGGDAAAAGDLLQEGARRAGPQLPWVDLLCRSWLALIALREGAWDRAAAACARAEAALAHPGLGDYATGALTHSASCLLLARAGEIDEARRRRAQARRLMLLVPDLAPWRAVACRAGLARASVIMGEPAAARTFLEEARDPAARMADSPVLRAELQAVRESVEGLAPGGPGRNVPLTAAETRVLRFLPTHHSFRDIGEQLHLSRFTVKSQALAIYRKLEVSSRGDAVARARALDLLDDERA